MNANYLNILTSLLKAGLLLLIVLVSVFIAQNSLLINNPLMASAVTFDLIITLPFAYWLLIRKTKVSKQTITVFIILGVIIASFVLPENNRRFLEIIKFYALPLMELGFSAYAAFLVYRTRQTFKTLREKGNDFMETLREILSKEFPNEFLGKAVSFEIAAFYYAFLNWGKQRGENSFTYHKQNGTVALLSVFIFILAAEAVVLHFLIVEISVIAAWVLTASSIYFLFQIFAHGKAIFLRPIEIADDKLFIRCGLLGDAEIDFENIESIEKIPLTFQAEKTTLSLSPLGKFTASNLKINLLDKAVLNGVYGMKKEFKAILLSVDDAENFIEKIKKGE